MSNLASEIIADSKEETEYLQKVARSFAQHAALARTKRVGNQLFRINRLLTFTTTKETTTATTTTTTTTTYNNNNTNNTYNNNNTNNTNNISGNDSYYCGNSKSSSIQYEKLLPRALIPGTDEYKCRQNLAEEAEIENQFFFDCVLKYASLPTSQQLLSSSLSSSEEEQQGIKIWASESDFGKTHSVLKSLMRDWSVEGKDERERCYKPLLDALSKYNVPKKSKVLVPGSGVGRLAVEVRGAGYSVQGNEVSLHMLLASDFILNAIPQHNHDDAQSNKSSLLPIHPFINETKNSKSFADRYRSVYIPDVHPVTLLNGCSLANDDDDHLSQELDFSMAAGDFASTYSSPNECEQWGCVLSAFFLDVAPDIIEYLQLIYKILEPGGYLINIGPLHYHWSGPDVRPIDSSLYKFKERNRQIDERYLNCVDYAWEDLRIILENIGFDVLEETIIENCYYTRDISSLMSSQYDCIMFVAKKR